MSKWLLLVLAFFMFVGCQGRQDDSPVVNVRIIDDVLYWNARQNVVSYQVIVNDEPYTVSVNSFSLSSLEDNAFYTITVSAVFENYQSKPSLTIAYHTYQAPLDTLSAMHNLKSMRDFSIEVTGETEIIGVSEGNRLLSASYVSFEQGILTIARQFFITATTGERVIEIAVEDGIYRLELTLISENETPGMLSPNSLTYQVGEDIELLFDLFGGTFDSLNPPSNLTLTEDDWDFSGSTLTIYHTFIDQVLLDNPDRQTIIFSYQLSLDDQIVIGYIFVHIDPSE